MVSSIPRGSKTSSCASTSSGFPEMRSRISPEEQNPEVRTAAWSRSCAESKLLRVACSQIVSPYSRDELFRAVGLRTSYTGPSHREAPRVRREDPSFTSTRALVLTAGNSENVGTPETRALEIQENPLGYKIIETRRRREDLRERGKIEDRIDAASARHRRHSSCDRKLFRARCLAAPRHENDGADRRGAVFDSFFHEARGLFESSRSSSKSRHPQGFSLRRAEMRRAST